LGKYLEKSVNIRNLCDYTLTWKLCATF